MAWRFGSYHWVEKGIIDNTVAGHVAGAIAFAGLGEVLLHLTGDMEGDLKGRRIQFRNPGYDADFVFDHGAGKVSTAPIYMKGFDRRQIGESGDIRGEPYFYVEWYSESNGRCVIELGVDAYTVIR